jgi:hypothetical protein
VEDEEEEDEEEEKKKKNTDLPWRQRAPTAHSRAFSIAP